MYIYIYIHKDIYIYIYINIYMELIKVFFNQLGQLKKEKPESQTQ